MCAADAIIDDINPATGHLAEGVFEVALHVVDGFVGPVCAADCKLIGRGRNGDDACAEQLGDFDGS